MPATQPLTALLAVFVASGTHSKYRGVIFLNVMGLRDFLRRVRFISEQGDQLHFPYVRWILTVVFTLAILLSVVGFALFARSDVLLDGPWDSYIIIILTIGSVLFIELTLAIPIGLYIGYRINSSIFGPFMRLKSTIRAIGEGDFSQRIQVRDDDVLTGIAEALCEMTEELENRFPQE